MSWPDDGAVIVFAVRCFLANGRQEEAAAAAERGLKLFPKSAATYASLAEVGLKAERRGEAVTWLKRGVEAVPQAQDLLWNLAQLQIDERQIDAAEKALAQLRTMKYPAPPIAYLEARLLIERGEWFEASQRLEGVRAALAEWPELSKQADYRLGQCYQELGRSDLQLTAYRRAAGVDADWLPARLGVASALLSIGHLDEALEEYTRIVELPGAPPSVLAQMARLMVLVNLRRNPSERNWDSADKLLDRLAELDPDAPAIPILRAEILLAKGAEDKAEELLTAARDKSPKTLDFWLGLAELAQRRGDATRAAELLDEAREAVGDSVQIRLVQARQLVNRLGNKAKDGLRKLVKTGDALSHDDQTALYASLAELTLAIEDNAETERLCTLVAERQPANLRVRLMLFDLAFREKKLEAMERVLEHVQRIEKSGPLWHYGEAIRLCVVAQSNNTPALYADAKQHLAEARIARPAWSRIPLLLAEINLAQGEEDAAISNSVQAIKLGERASSVVSRTVSLLHQRRRFVEADQLIRHLQEQSSPFSSQMTRLATDISMQLKDNERALDLVTKAASQSKDRSDHIWAGQVLSALGKYAEAEENFRRAIELDETAAAAWVALIQLLGRTSQVQKAEDTLAEAEKKIAAAEAPLALAQALESIGKPVEAETRYKAALAAAPDQVLVIRKFAEFYLQQGRPHDAEPLLKKLIDSKAEASDENRLWARRNLALTLMTQAGDKSALKQALALLEENLAVQRDSEVDRQAKAMVLALFPDRDSHLAAVEIFEKLLADRQTQMVEEQTGEARFLLVQLYMNFGDASKAMSHLRKLMAAHGDKPRYLKYYVQFLINRGEIGEAELWLDKLVKAAPREFATLELTTTIQFELERFEELLNSVNAFVSSFSENDAEQQRITLNAARLLEIYAAGSSTERFERLRGPNRSRGLSD